MLRALLLCVFLITPALAQDASSRHDQLQSALVLAKQYQQIIDAGADADVDLLRMNRRKGDESPSMTPPNPMAVKQALQYRKALQNLNTLSKALFSEEADFVRPRGLRDNPNAKGPEHDTFRDDVRAKDYTHAFFLRTHAKARAAEVVAKIEAELAKP